MSARRMKVAVLGGGSGACATAAAIAAAGHDVRLWLSAAEDLGPLRAAGGITVTGEGRPRKVKLERITGEVAEAVSGSTVVVAPFPATGHRDLAARLAPVLEESQVVLLTPGIFGSYAVARDIARAGGRLPFAVAETSTAPCRGRQTGPAEVTAPARAADLPAGVFPAARTAAAVEHLRPLFPAIRPCRDVLDVALTSAGPVVHPPLVLLTAAAVDAGRIDIQMARTAPGVRRLIDAVDAERRAIRAGLGCPAPHDAVSADDDEGRAEPPALALDHRYVTDDVVLGLSLLESAGRLAAADTPAISGLLSVFTALLGRDVRAEGRGLDRLGLGDFVRREIDELLRDGWLSTLWRRALAG